MAIEDLVFVDGAANGFRVVAEIDAVSHVPRIRDGENLGTFPVGDLVAVRVEMFAPANPMYLVDGKYGFKLDWDRFGVSIPWTFYDRIGGTGTGERFVMPPSTPFNLGLAGTLRTDTSWERAVHGPQSITLEQEVTIRIDNTAGVSEDWSFTSAPTVDNLLVCIPGIDKNKAVGTGCGDGGSPSWTLVREHGVGTTSAGTSGAILVKDAQGDENNTQTTTWSISSADICQWAGEYSGTEPASSVIDLNFAVTPSPISRTSVDVDSDPTTTDQADELAIFMAFRDSENEVTPTYSDGFTEIWNSNGTGVLAGTYIGGKTLSATGTVRCLIETGGSNDEMCGIGVTLRQASSAGTQTTSLDAAIQASKQQTSSFDAALQKSVEGSDFDLGFANGFEGHAPWFSFNAVVQKAITATSSLDIFVSTGVDRSGSEAAFLRKYGGRIFKVY